MVLNKRKQAEAEAFLSGILDSQEADVVVVRGEDWSVLYTNASAAERLGARDAENGVTDRRGYAALFPDLCRVCPRPEAARPDGPMRFDVEDEDHRLFSVTCGSITWLDGKPAGILFLRDVEDRRVSEKKLYDLAYIDQLTGVPNRQKFKEDFEAVAEEIEKNRMSGIVAIFDLDNFKSVNDTYGHNTGDIMLRRLTEHLNGLVAFKDHIYRLGGDEFVLFYAERSECDADGEALRARLDTLLDGALQSYTMPAIDLSCTISMGVAFFPRHGFSASELLRKADIALYQAKEAGKNRKVFFEDRYDGAKKFKDHYVNIRPILNSGGRTYGYELIDRDEGERSGDAAVDLTEINRAMDALGLEDLENAARYFIAYTDQLYDAAVLKNLPKDKFVVQVRLPAAVGKAEMERYLDLRAKGYAIAMSGMRRSNGSKALIALADYLMFEVGGKDDAYHASLIGQNPKKIFVATNVDTAYAYDMAKGQGFHLYCGYFFKDSVETRKTKEIEPMKANYYHLLKLTSGEGYVDFREISAVISSDVALSYKLLRLLNSAAVGLRYRVSSIPMAVAYLGEEYLKKWISLLALRGAASDKPLELLRVSLIRARLGELLTPYFRPRRDPKRIFLTGMFSLLHIALDQSKETLFREISVAEDIRESLTTKNGPYSDLVAFFSHYEYGNWEEVTRFAQEKGIGSQAIGEAYLEAVKWYNDLADGKK